MRIVLLGAPGSGKGTQAALIEKQFGLPHISTGELLRAAVKEGTPLGKAAKAVIDRGELVSDEIMLSLLEERLGRGDLRNGFILDGYPRNVSQAKELDELLARLDQPVQEALQIDVDEEQLIKRIAGRAALEGRADDSEEVVRNRMQVYAVQTAPVTDYYARKGILTRVLGEGNIDEVFQRINGALRTRVC
jgi:adenylate kinase